MRAGFVAVLILLGGYVIADSVDAVPGILTMADPPPEPQAYPSLAPVTATLPEMPSETDAEGPDVAQIEKAVNALADDERITGSLSMTVADPLSGEILYAHEGDKGRIPASNMKLLTAAAVLDGLGADATLPTRAVLDGDTVYLVGGGDTQLSPDAGDPDAIVGHAGLGDLAEQAADHLKESGVESVKVLLDTSLFDTTPYFGSLDESDRIYVMAMTPIAIYGGEREDRTMAEDPAWEAVGAFAAALSDEGITVSLTEGKAEGISPEPTEANTIGRVDSAPVGELVDHMLRVSDNTIAQSLGHILAAHDGRPTNFSGAADAVMNHLDSLGYPLTGVTIDDCAGLSTENRITTGLITAILADAATCDCAIAALPSGLPVAHLQGTLANRFADADLQGLVRAKTGTLIEVNSLSGYMLVPGGKVLSFSILIDGIEPGTTRIARSAIDDCLEMIASGKESS